MYKEDIRIEAAIVHICDSTVGMPVLSDTVIDFGSEFADFLREHIYKIVSEDECKTCSFHQNESEIYQLLKEYEDAHFVETSKKIAAYLYEIMNSNIDIPAADLVVVRFKTATERYMALLKMNYKEFYTHRTKTAENGSTNEIIKYKSILPTESQRLQEAAVINLRDFSVRLLEKKYEVNGSKTNYFSFLFLKCSSHLSHKSKLAMVTKAVEAVQKDNYDESEQFARHMQAKEIIHEELQEKGSFTVEEIAEKVFEEKPELKAAFQEKIEKYDIVKEKVEPQSERTLAKYQKQHLLTDTGIEIKIPMEQYRNAGSVEFITNPNGTTNVVIKNIEHLTAKF